MGFIVSLFFVEIHFNVHSKYSCLMDESIRWLDAFWWGGQPVLEKYFFTLVSHSLA